MLRDVIIASLILVPFAVAAPGKPVLDPRDVVEERGWR